MQYSNDNTIYGQIKGRITMYSAARRYGFEPNRSNCIVCPFHREDTASLRLYKDSFYCFGCGAGGDVIKFVSKLYGIGNYQAAVRINEDFCLGLTNKKASRAEQQQFMKKQAEEKRELDEYRAEFNRKTEEFKLLRSLPKPATEDEGEKYAKHLARLDYLENYWFVENRWR